MGAILASDLSTRMAALVARHDHGDYRAAATRLGIAPERLAGLLSGDWRGFSLDALAALVRGYGVTMDWLLAPAGGRSQRRHPRPACRAPGGARLRPRGGTDAGNLDEEERSDAMSETKRIPPEQLEAYFEAFTRRFLRSGSPEAVDLEVLGAEWGDQHEAEGARLIGITYDPRDRTLEIAIEGADRRVADHRIYEPQEVWVMEEQEGFPGSIAVVRDDGVREVVSVKPVGLRRLD